MEQAPDLQDVTAFLAVVDTGSFTAAAKRLGLAKSNISRRVARLEEQLGARLLDRTTRRQRLTEIGETYHQHVTGAVQGLADAAQSVLELQGEPRGRLRMTAPADWNDTMGPLIAEFSRRYPKLQLEIELTQRRVDLLGDGFDVAIRAGKLADSSLVARKLGQTAGHLFASPGYLAEHGAPPTPRQLPHHPCVLFRGRQGQTQWKLYDTDEMLHEVTVRGVISTQDFSLVRDAVIRGAGIGMLPDTVGGPAVDSGQLLLVLPGYRTARSDLSVVYPSARFIAPKTRVFVDFCVEWLGEHLQRCTHAIQSPPTPTTR